MSLLAQFMVDAVSLYRRYISPATVRHCRFEPTCSEYALVAITRHGALRGVVMAASRLCRCHPWAPGGNDPVPVSRSVR